MIRASGIADDGFSDRRPRGATARSRLADASARQGTYPRHPGPESCPAEGRWRDWCGGASQAEYQSQRGVDLAQFIEAEVPGRLSQALRIHSTGLLSQHPGQAAVDDDFRTEGGRACRGGRRCDQPATQTLSHEP